MKPRQAMITENTKQQHNDANHTTQQINDTAYSLVTCRQQGTSWSDSTDICCDSDAWQDTDLLADIGTPSVSACCVGRNPVEKSPQNQSIQNN